MKQQIIQIIESHRPPMIHPTNRSGGEYAVAVEVNDKIDKMIEEIRQLSDSETRDMFKCKDCGHTLVRNRSRGTLYCGICKK